MQNKKGFSIGDGARILPRKVKPASPPPPVIGPESHRRATLEVVESMDLNPLAVNIRKFPPGHTAATPSGAPSRSHSGQAARATKEDTSFGDATDMWPTYNVLFMYMFMFVSMCGVT